MPQTIIPLSAEVIIGIHSQIHIQTQLHMPQIQFTMENLNTRRNNYAIQYQR